VCSRAVRQCSEGQQPCVRVAVRCSMVQCVAVCCSVLQCVAVCCSVSRVAALLHSSYALLVPYVFVAVCCSVLQCVAVCCSVLQCVAVCYNMLQYTALCCSVLQSHNNLAVERVCVCACTCLCVFVRARARVRVCVHVRMHVRVHVRVRMYQCDAVCAQEPCGSAATGSSHVYVLQCDAVCCSVCSRAVRQCGDGYQPADMPGARGGIFFEAHWSTIGERHHSLLAQHLCGQSACVCTWHVRHECALEYCNTLRHAATHCDTLQHTVTRCNTL